MFWVFCSCFGGISVVSWQCSGGVLVVLKECFFKTKLAHLSIPNWRKTKRATLLLGLCAGLIFEILKQNPRNVLDKIACETCVTLWIEGSELYLMGFKTAIQDALDEIGKAISSPDLIPCDMADPPNTAREVYHLAPLIRFAPHVQSPSHDPKVLKHIGGSDANSTGVRVAVNKVNKVNAPYGHFNQFNQSPPIMSTEGGSTLPKPTPQFHDPFWRSCHALPPQRLNFDSVEWPVRLGVLDIRWY